MRKIIPLILSLALVLALAACGSHHRNHSGGGYLHPHRGHHHQPERQRGPHGPHRPL